MNWQFYQNMFDLSGKVALVTGAGRGIGAAIAEALCARGAMVFVADIMEDAAGRVAADLQKQQGQAKGIHLDVTSTDAVNDAIGKIGQEKGRLDILVNNAGMSARIPAEDYPDEDLEKMIDLNLKGVFRCMRSAARLWIDKGFQGGNIINLASFAGLFADPLSAPYAATKGAVVQLTRTCAVEWADKQIRVNAIAPGYVRTEMTAKTLDNPETGKIIRAKTPMGRPGTPEEIAGAAVFLASDASRYVTGHILPVDGGWAAV